MAQMFAIGAAAAAIGIAAAVERVNRPQTLYDAARRDHVLALKELLNQGHDPFRPNRNGDTPLHLAACHGSENVMNELLKYYPSLAYTRNAKRNTPLIEAVEAGIPRSVYLLIKYDKSEIQRAIAASNHPRVTKVLLEALEDNGAAMMCTAAHNGQINKLLKLLESGASPNLRDHAGLAPIHHASASGKVQCIAVLIKYKAYVHARCKAGNTPLHIAAQNNQLESARILLKGGASRILLNNVGQIPYDIPSSPSVENLVKPNLLFLLMRAFTS
ncbi:Transient receptor potential cation channel subfamily A member 1 [Gryllus bimaculatus]|nr:Transient receptor potential cation channel subfamily A member 1 [Gryllus bimaculatus]